MIIRLILLLLLGVVLYGREGDAFLLPSTQPNEMLIRRNPTHNHEKQIRYGFGRRVSSSSAFMIDPFSTTETLSFLDEYIKNMGREQAEALAGPFFGASLFPYLAFLWLLAREENQCPKGVTVGFTTCLLFVFLTIPAAIASQVLYGISLADSDWLHGSAESLLTITNLVTVVAFRQALDSKEKGAPMPLSATNWSPMVWLVVGSTVLASITAIVPAISDPLIHTKYLGGFMDLPFTFPGANPEPGTGIFLLCYAAVVLACTCTCSC
jgi:hypothetical protein